MENDAQPSARGLSAFYQTYLERPLGLTSGRRYLSECESIRGWAVLLVILYHWMGEIVPWGPVDANPLMAFIFAGGTGVNLFYVLSAFLLSMPWFRGNDLPAAKFYRNRLLRIMPLYLTAVAIATIYTGKYFEGLKSALFLDLYIMTLAPFGGVWLTLAVEMQFYLILPFLMTFVRDDRWRYLGILLLLLVTAISAYYYFAPDGKFSLKLGSVGIANMFSRWPAFLTGIICAYIYTRKDPREINAAPAKSGAPFLGRDLLLLSLILAMGFFFKSIVAVGLFKAHATWPHILLVESAFWGCILMTILYLPGRLTRLFINPLMNVLGVLSYSIYLLHMPVLQFSMKYLKGNFPEWFVSPGIAVALASLAILAAVLGLSLVTYIYVERPFIAKKAKH